MAHFEWQTEEDEVTWDKGESGAPSPQRGPLGRWLTLLLVVTLAGLLIIFVYRQVNDRVAEVADDVETEVLASHDIVRYAAEQRDAEVLVTFLSGRDPAWSDLQQSLTAEGLLFDRESLGLQLLPAGSPERAALGDRRRVVSITIAPDLTEATVTAAQAYAVRVGNGVTETVYLEQESVYRQGEDRWLYAPPETDPIYTEVSGNHLVVRYDQGEGEIGRRLAADLDRKVSELCNLPGTACPPGFRVHLQFVGAPQSLAQIANPALFLQSSRPADGQRDINLQLPAPSLVGRPRDEAGYRALYRGYAAQLLRVLLTWQAWPWSCCDHAPVFQALVEQQLVHLGVQASPLDPADYQQLLQENFALFEDTMQSWYGRQFVAPGSRAWLEAQAVVAFLWAEQPQVSLAQMAGSLNHAANFWFWAYEFLGRRVADTALTQAWLEFAYQQAGLTRAEPPDSWPTATALLLCGADYAHNRRLFRYEPEQNALVELVTDRGFLDLQSLPDGEGALLIEAGGAGNDREIRLSLWRDEALQSLWNSQETNVSLSYNWSAVDASGQKLTMMVEGREGVTNILLDLAACLEGRCAAQVLPGRLFWSPDGEHSLIAETDRLSLADGMGEIIRPVVDSTYSAPFWLDSYTYGYLRRVDSAAGGPGLGELVAGDVGTGEERVLVTVAELAEFLPLDPVVYHLAAVAPNPANRRQLLLQLIDYTSSSAAADLFLLDRTTGEIRSLFEAGGWLMPQIAPDGRWLALYGAEPEPEQSALLLHDLSSERQLRIPQRRAGGFAWSPDGRWLLSAGGSVIHLIAPDENYRQVLVHDRPQCGAVAWTR